MNAQSYEVIESRGCSAVPRGKWFDPAEQALDWAPISSSSSAIDSSHGLHRGILFHFHGP